MAPFFAVWPIHVAEDHSQIMIFRMFCCTFIASIKFIDFPSICSVKGGHIPIIDKFPRIFKENYKGMEIWWGDNRAVYPTLRGNL